MKDKKVYLPVIPESLIIANKKGEHLRMFALIVFKIVFKILDKLAVDYLSHY
jgi:hypothetical protein